MHLNKITAQIRPENMASRKVADVFSELRKAQTEAHASDTQWLDDEDFSGFYPGTSSGFVTDPRQCPVWNNGLYPYRRR